RDPRVRYVDVESAADLEEACRTEFPACDVLLMAAAVAGFRPPSSHPAKLKKAGRDDLVVTLEATPDILAGLAAARRADQTVVGFAAEHGAGALDAAREKLRRKALHAVVLNDVSRADIGFDSPDNEVTIVSVAGERRVERASKRLVAGAVLDAVVEMRAASGAGAPA
ncbi:MAG: phosphopantothenoylcysteine decarboxylase / phosphopantothenate---cysteine ligase, partial [Solirubrobacteraceae bacterium]|nr:phosphopantothenoylcysteine decarboxylase / phosphopantothenate---cysteine ligase [Solirubrobacteraceae bacterium]